MSPGHLHSFASRTDADKGTNKSGVPVGAGAEFTAVEGRDENPVGFAEEEEEEDAATGPVVSSFGAVEVGDVVSAEETAGEKVGAEEVAGEAAEDTAGVNVGVVLKASDGGVRKGDGAEGLVGMKVATNEGAIDEEAGAACGCGET